MLANRGPLIAMPDNALITMSSEAEAVRDGLRTAMASSPILLLSDDDQRTAEIVLAEVLNNVVEHAYANHKGDIRLSLTLTQGMLNCLIEDEGLAMPGGELPAGDLPEATFRQVRGFGWHLIRVLSTGLTYQRSGSTNRLSFSLPAERSGC
jgi:serine/threonine-protein kinase RsbW